MATWDLSFGHLAAIVAGALIVCVGVFVLVARPGAIFHRLFFLLALADGASTVLFSMSYIAVDAPTALLFRGLYWYYFLAFLALLAIFAIIFPAPIGRPRTIALLVTLTLATAAALIALYARRHELFWVASRGADRIVYGTPPLGNVAHIAFVVATGAVLARMCATMLSGPSSSHRRQAAFVLGGMVLAFGPYAATVAGTALASDPLRTFVFARPDRLVAYWTYLAFCAGMALVAAQLIRRRAHVPTADLRFVMACFGAVGVLAIASMIATGPIVGQVLRQLALLAYPILLGYAIARYEVFDIDRKLRRAATVTFAAMGLTLAFVLIENAAENLLQQRVFAGVSSAWISGSAAAIIATVGFVPIARASRKAAAKLVPELSQDELHVRKLEIYRHSLAGALADGILREGESRTLAALRSSLGITDTEHASLLREVAA